MPTKTAFAPFSRPNFHVDDCFFLLLQSKKNMEFVKTPIYLCFFFLCQVWLGLFLRGPMDLNTIIIVLLLWDIAGMRACDHRSHASFTGAREIKAEWETKDFVFLCCYYYLFRLSYEGFFPECHCSLSLTHKHALAYMWPDTVSTTIRCSKQWSKNST